MSKAIRFIIIALVILSSALVSVFVSLKVGIVLCAVSALLSTFLLSSSKKNEKVVEEKNYFDICLKAYWYFMAKFSSNDMEGLKKICTLGVIEKLKDVRIESPIFVIEYSFLETKDDTIRCKFISRARSYIIESILTFQENKSGLKIIGIE